MIIEFHRGRLSLNMIKENIHDYRVPVYIGGRSSLNMIKENINDYRVP